MRYARIALLTAAATWLLPFATPAIAQVSLAELGHPSGCLMCSPVTVDSWRTPGYSYRGAPVVGPELEWGVPPPLANRRHVEAQGHAGSHPTRYTAMRP
jgi:hypothetical protein